MCQANVKKLSLLGQEMTDLLFCCAPAKDFLAGDFDFVNLGDNVSWFLLSL